MTRIARMLSCLLLSASGFVLANAQLPPRTPQRVPDGSKVWVISGRREIPEASLDGTTEEIKWWQDLRAAGEAVRKTKGKKERETLISLLLAGHEKSYRAPIPDQRAFALVLTEPQYTQSARRAMARGVVQLMVEFREDGFIGEVEVTAGLRPDLDGKAMEAARRTIFLPAVKDRHFVTIRTPMEMRFNIY